jgi:hypothetical protein
VDNELETQNSRLAENPGGRWIGSRYRTASYTRALSDSRRTLVNSTPVFAVSVDMNPRTVWFLCRCRHKAHYADIRIMPTCVGNPVYGAGIAAMESA